MANINIDKDSKKSGNETVWKAVSIGLGIGVVAVVGTGMVVANRLSKNEGLQGAALVTSTLANIGGGPIKDGGKGMVGGLVRLCLIATAGVAAGSCTSVLHDVVKDTSDDKTK